MIENNIVQMNTNQFNGIKLTTFHPYGSSGSQHSDESQEIIQAYLLIFLFGFLSPRKVSGMQKWVAEVIRREFFCWKMIKTAYCRISPSASQASATVCFMCETNQNDVIMKYSATMSPSDRLVRMERSLFHGIPGFSTLCYWEGKKLILRLKWYNYRQM